MMQHRRSSRHVSVHGGVPRRPWTRHVSAPYRPAFEQLERRNLLTISLPDTAAWVEQGPGPIDFGGGFLATGAINGIAADPNNANIAYVATVNGGVWKTTDATNASPSWAPLTDNLASLSMGCIAISPLDSNTVYAGSARNSSYGGDGGPAIGLIKTADGGATWDVLGPSALTGRQIVSVIPTVLSGAQGQVVLVATWLDGGGVYRSSDGGNSFVRVSGAAGSGLPDAGVSQMVEDPGNSLCFYAGVRNQGVYRSTDGGLTWSPVNNGLTNTGTADKIKLAVYNNAAAGTNAVYAAFVDNQGNLTGFFRTTNRGGNWVSIGLIANGGLSINVQDIVADPSDPTVVFVGTYGVGDYRGDASQALGSQWTSIEGANAGNTSPHVDSRDMAFDANGNLLESDDGGIYRLANPDNAASRNWQPVVGDLRITEMHEATYDSLNHTIFGGTQDNFNPTQQAAGNLTWGEAPGGGDGGFTQIDTTTVPGSAIHYVSAEDLDDFARVTYNSSNNVVAYQPVGLQVNGTGGKTLYDLDNESVVSLYFVQAFFLNAVDPTRMLIGTGTDPSRGITSAHIYESFDQGDTLTDVTTLPAGIGRMAYGGRRNGFEYPDVFYAAAGNKLYLRTALGGPITELSNYTGNSISQIVLDPEDWEHAFVSDTSGHVWMTANAGATPFIDITGNLPPIPWGSSTDSALQVFSPQMSKGDDEVLFGTVNGVYRTINPSAGSGALWFPYGTNLPHALVEDLNYNSNDNVLVAGTFGRSAWTVSDATNTLIPDLEIDGDTDSPGENDTIRLAADAANPAILDVYINSITPTFSTHFSLIKSIHVNGLGGSNTLIEDYSNGDPLPAGGVTYENTSVNVISSLVVTNTNDSGDGSLRQAIIDANAKPGRDTISFDIPGSGPFVIEPQSALPYITDPVVLDGSTQPGYNGVPLIVLDGDQAGSTDGILLKAGDSIVRGFVVQNFTYVGIDIDANDGGNVIAGNYIGTDATGTQPASNGTDGIYIGGSSNNVIGGGTSSDRNVISGNTLNGVEMGGFATPGNLVMGNYIGVDVTGSKPLGNGADGVYIRDGAHDNRIGVDGADADAAGEANVISGNGHDGVGIEGSNSDSNTVAGNLIGTDSTGTIALGGNHYGVRIGSGASNNVVGSAGANSNGAAERNVIAGNLWDGVYVTDSGTQGNQVVLNWIGTPVGGAVALANGGDGLHIVNDASNTFISTNVIEFNQGAGVAVDSGVGNDVGYNTIYSNGGLGIDLGSDGVTPNHVGGPLSGPDDWQNYPVLSSVAYDGSEWVVQGTLAAAANTAYYITLYHSPLADPSGFGEGFLLAAFFQVTTDASGNASFTQDISGGISASDVLSATATAPNGDTSEFSQVATLINHAPSFAAGNPPAVEENTGQQTIAGWAQFDPGIGSNEATQTATYTVSNVSNPALFAVPPAVSPDGTLTYTLAPNQSGTSNFDAQVQDSGGTANGGVNTSAPKTFDLTVREVLLTQVATGAASSITATGATLNGTVNAESSTASVSFQYSTDSTFTPTVETNVGSGFSQPYGVTVDAAGDVFVADTFNSAVKEVARGGGTIQTLGSGFSYPSGVAVDAAGDVFVADSENNAVKEILPGGTILTLGSGFGYPFGIAVNAAGDVFVADSGHSAIKEIPHGGGTIQTLGSGFNGASGVAVDAAGDVFVADTFNNAVKEIPHGGGTIQTLGSGFYEPFGVAVDAAGDVFVADTYNNAVKEIPHGGGTIQTLGSGFSLPRGVAVDAAGDVFVADQGNYRVVELSPPSVAATPATLSGSTDTAVSAALTDLNPGTTYYYRVVATSANGTVADASSPPRSFTTPTITWAHPADITYGTPLGSAQLDATASIPGTFSYTLSDGSPAVGADLNAAQGQVLKATFTPTDSTDYATGMLQVDINVAPAPLTVTGGGSQVYGGSPVFSAAYSGFVLGQDSTALNGTLAFATTTAAASDVGTYDNAVTPSGLTSTNYTISFAKGDMVVTPAALTVTGSGTQVYGGSPVFTASYSGFVLDQNSSALGGTLVFTTTTSSSSDVGTYPNAVTPGGLTSTNYAISFVKGDMVVTPAAPGGLSVTGVQPTDTGFTVTFNEAIDPSVLQLYDTAATNNRSPDVTLKGAAVGFVGGSLVVDAGNESATFIATVGVLPPDSYTLTLRSAADGFEAPDGTLLTGSDGTAGDDYSTTFTVAAPAAGAVVVSLPSFARGPRQVVSVPANVTSGIPLTVSQAQGITSLALDMEYDPSLLDITGATSSLPGATVNVNTSVTGVAHVTLSVPAALTTATDLDIIDLQANVPSSAADSYRSKEILAIRNVSVNGGAIAALEDDALQVVAYLGDVRGQLGATDQGYKGGDALLIARVAAGLDAGFAAFPLVAPMIVGGVRLTPEVSVSGADALQLARAAAGLGSTLPPLPYPLPGTTIAAASPDFAPAAEMSIAAMAPTLALSVSNAPTTPDSDVTVPIDLSDGGVNLSGLGAVGNIQLVIRYDPKVLTAAASAVSLGSLTQGWSLTQSTPDNTAGELFVEAQNTGGLTGAFSGDVFDIKFHVAAGATGSTKVSIASTYTDSGSPPHIYDTEIDDETSNAITLNPAPTNDAADPVFGTVTVSQTPAITSAGSTTFTAGTAGTFTITASGVPTPTISTSDTLPNGVTLTDKGDGTATLASTSAAPPGVYHFTIDAGNGVGTDATQSFTLTVSAATPTLALSIPNAPATPDSDVTVPIDLSDGGANLSGLGAVGNIQLVVRYDPSALTAAAGAVSLGSLTQGWSLTQSTPDNTAGELFVEAQSTGGLTGTFSGDVFDIKFHVAAGAAGSTKVSIASTYTDSGSPPHVYDTEVDDETSNLITLNPAPTNDAADPVFGTLKVSPQNSADATLSVGNVPAAAGMQITLPITLGDGNDNLSASDPVQAIEAVVTYDPNVLTIDGVAAGPLLTGGGQSWLLDSNTNYNGSGNTIVIGAVSATGLSGDFSGETFDLTFTVNAAATGNTAVYVVQSTADGQKQTAVTLADSTKLTLSPAPTNDAADPVFGTVAIGLTVTSVQPNDTGFTVTFSQAIDPSVLHLYDTQASGLRPADVRLVGQSVGAVTGSLVVAPDNQSATFIATDGVLPPDKYTLTLRGAADGFETPSGTLLTGSDGTAGHDYTSDFTVAAPPSGAVTLSLPNFARGPGQSVNVPASATAGIPLKVSQAAGITSLTLDVDYDPALLDITGVTSGVSGASVHVDTSVSGVAHITFSVAAPLSAATDMDLLDIQAMVPTVAAADYAQAQILHLANVSINSGAITSLPGDALDEVAYLGDVRATTLSPDGQGGYHVNGYSLLDALAVLKVAVATDSGFAAFPLVDPRVVGGVTGAAKLGLFDALDVLKAALGLSVGVIPPLPASISPTVVATPMIVHAAMTGRFSPLASGATEGAFSVDNISGLPGTQITVPVRFSDGGVNLSGTNPLQAIQAVITYDPTVLTLDSVSAGSLLTSGGQSWLVSSNNNYNGSGDTIVVGGISASGLSGNFSGVVFNLTFTINTAATAATSVYVRAGTTDGQEQTYAALEDSSDLTLNPTPINDAGDPVVGTVTISQAPTITSADSATFIAGTLGIFKITAAGAPTAAITEIGSLPSGVTLTDNGDNTATLASTAATPVGVYHFTIDAGNGVGTDALQTFILTVGQAPRFTSDAAATFTAGTTGMFTATATGFPVAALTEIGALPSGVSLQDNGDGTATLTSTITAAAGVYHFSLDASNGIAPDATQAFTLTVLAVPVITWSNPADITYGVKLDDTQLDATANVSGSFSYTLGDGLTGANGAILTAGQHFALNATFTPDDTAHYSTSTARVEINVNPATLMVTAHPQTKVYGQIDPALTYAASGFQFSDTAATVLTGDLARAPGEMVAGGPYAISQGTLAADSNYVINYTGANLSITPATLTVTAHPQTKVYGQTDPALSYAASGFQFSDIAATVLTGALTRAAGETVAGGSYAIGQSTLAADSNYVISYTGASLSITPATLTVTANPQTKVYGQIDPALTYAASGFQFSDNAATVLTGDLIRVPGETVAGGPYAISRGTLAADSNYVIGYIGASLSITPAPLTVTANPQTKVYGAADPVLTYAASGFKFSDAAATVLTGVLTRAAGETVAGGPYAINQNTLAADSNYVIGYTGASLSITPATLTVTAHPQTKVYGQTDPALTYAASGFQFSDAAATVLTGDLARAPGETVAGGPYAINQNTLAADSNYVISYTGASLSITPATLTVTAQPQTKVYGQTDPALTYTASGFQFSDADATVLTGAMTRAPGETVAGGPYAISQNTLAANRNYVISYTGANVSITPATLTVTADDKTRAYGDQNPPLTATMTGFANGDDISAVGGTASLTTSATASSPAGTYPITAALGTLHAANYVFSFQNGALTITVNAQGEFAAADDVYVIGSGTITVPANIGLLANDSGQGQLAVTAGSQTGAEGGRFVLNANGSFTYTPPASFAGFDYTRYIVGDAQGDMAGATVTVLSQTGGVVWKFYESVLGRNPDYAGLQGWINDFSKGGKPGDIAAGFFESTELLDQIVNGYYQQYLGRAPQGNDLDYWGRAWRENGGPELIKAQFASSQEFNALAHSLYGAYPDGWITALYERILNRAPEPGALPFWEKQLAGGTTEGQVTLEFFTSPEAFGNDVSAWFEEYLGRAPSAAELQQYATQMLGGATDRDIEQAITNLPDYSADPPKEPTGTAAPLPDYFRPKGPSSNNQQALVEAQHALFARWGE